MLDLAYGELTPTDATVAQTHVEGCAECAHGLAEIRGVRRVMAGLPREPAPESGAESLLAYAAQAARRRSAGGGGGRFGRAFAVLGSLAALVVLGVVAQQVLRKVDPVTFSPAAGGALSKAVVERGSANMIDPRVAPSPVEPPPPEPVAKPEKKAQRMAPKEAEREAKVNPASGVDKLEAEWAEGNDRRVDGELRQLPQDVEKKKKEEPLPVMNGARKQLQAAEAPPGGAAYGTGAGAPSVGILGVGRGKVWSAKSAAGGIEESRAQPAAANSVRAARPAVSRAEGVSSSAGPVASASPSAATPPVSPPAHDAAPRMKDALAGVASQPAPAAPQAVWRRDGAQAEEAQYEFAADEKVATKGDLGEGRVAELRGRLAVARGADRQAVLEALCDAEFALRHMEAAEETCNTLLREFPQSRQAALARERVQRARSVRLDSASQKATH
jgi:hypothetical protein